MADLLLETDLDGEQKTMVENILSSGNALLTVINDILDFSKVESGKMEIEHVQFNLFTVIAEVMRMLSFEAEKKRLEFSHDIQLRDQGRIVKDICPSPDCFAIAAGFQCNVMGDPGRLRQVLTNLISNSMIYHSLLSFFFPPLSFLF